MRMAVNIHHQVDMYSANFLGQTNDAFVDGPYVTQHTTSDAGVEWHRGSWLSPNEANFFRWEAILEGFSTTCCGSDHVFRRKRTSWNRHTRETIWGFSSWYPNLIRFWQNTLKHTDRRAEGASRTYRQQHMEFIEWTGGKTRRVIAEELHDAKYFASL